MSARVRVYKSVPEAGKYTVIMDFGLTQVILPCVDYASMEKLYTRILNGLVEYSNLIVN